MRKVCDFLTYLFRSFCPKKTKKDEELQLIDVSEEEKFIPLSDNNYIENKKIDIIEKIVENYPKTHLKHAQNQEINFEKETAMSLTMKSLISVSPDKRDDFLRNFCQQIDNAEFKIPLPPMKTSIAFDKSNKNIKASLEKVQAPQKFLETTEAIEIEEISKQIENITAYNVIKGTKQEISEIKITSSELKTPQLLLQKEIDNMREALQKDIAKKLGISPKDVYIRRFVPGSIEILFSVPENIRGLNLNADDLPNFKQILEKSGVSKFDFKQKNVIPDPEKALELLQNYTRPVIIKTKSNGSQLMDKFQKYIPALASLSTNVRIVHNEKNHTLEIYGPPSEKGQVLSYLAEIEDALQGATMANIVIVPQQKPISNYYSSLWDCLYSAAKDFVLNKTMQFRNPIQYHTLRQNPNLIRGCPAARSFVAAVDKMKLNLKSPGTIENQGMFGWHGTGSAQAVANIAENNLDPSRRSGQVFGRGEYFATDPNYSQSFYWGDTNTLFLFFILKGHLYFQCHDVGSSDIIVIDNPSQEEMYVVPILIATFNNQTPLKIEPDNVIKCHINWEWMDLFEWVPYGTGQVTSKDSIQNAIEGMYQNYKKGISIPVFTLTLIRLNDKKTDVYKIDFSSMKQTNMRTDYQRDIQRKEKSKKTQKSDI